jgi:hypothetical protein
MCVGVYYQRLPIAAEALLAPTDSVPSSRYHHIQAVPAARVAGVRRPRLGPQLDLDGKSKSCPRYLPEAITKVCFAVDRLQFRRPHDR